MKGNLLRIATYNIHFGGTGRTAPILDVLESLNCEVILLVEADDQRVVSDLANGLAMHHVHAQAGKSHLAILSKQAPISWESYCPAGINRSILAADVTSPSGQIVTIYGVHLQCHYFRHNEKQRLKELSAYLRYMKTRPPTPHVILGDFNAVAPGDAFDKNTLPLKEKLMLMWERGQVYRDALAKLPMEGYTDCFRALHPGQDGFTLPVQTPHVRLDYIFADPLMSQSLQSCLVVTAPTAARVASDHYPVLAEFAS